MDTYVSYIRIEKGYKVCLAISKANSNNNSTKMLIVLTETRKWLVTK